MTAPLDEITSSLFTHGITVACAHEKALLLLLLTHIAQIVPVLIIARLACNKPQVHETRGHHHHHHLNYHHHHHRRVGSQYKFLKFSAQLPART